MNGALSHNSSLENFTGSGTTMASEINFGVNHAPGAESITWPIDLQSSALPLCHNSNEEN